MPVSSASSAKSHPFLGAGVLGRRRLSLAFALVCAECFLTIFPTHLSLSRCVTNVTIATRVVTSAILKIAIVTQTVAVALPRVTIATRVVTSAIPRATIGTAPTGKDRTTSYLWYARQKLAAYGKLLASAPVLLGHRQSNSCDRAGLDWASA